MSSRTRLWAAGVCALASATAFGAEPSRQIEEVIVTAEKREATVSDTSISITAIDSSMLEELGMQGPDDLVNYTPATTRDAYDIRIRGVGRNFRALGGDPGVATYYNGVYSEDFGIASTENALYDVQRVEVLRGPQGTLYGRNAIGGALNYLTNLPTMTWTGEARTQFGNLGAKEYYGILSGPILEDMLAFRLTGIKLMRDGSQEGYNKSEDVNTINDRNVAIALLFQPIESITANLRFNDRRSDRDIGSAPLINEGPNGSRGVRDTVHYGYGLRPVTSTTPGALPFVHPVTGATLYGAYVRPGVDSGPWPHQPNPAFQSPAARLNNGGGDKEDVDHEALTNGLNDEVFEHAAVTFDIAWDTGIGTFKYIYGYGDFEYTFDIDNDFSDEGFSQYRQVVLEDVYNYSHELQYLWEIGEKVTGTTGLYNFYSRRRQDYGLINATAQGRYVNPMNYGTLALLPPQFGPIVPALYGPHRKLGDAAPFQSLIGVWGGDPDGYVYHHDNELLNTSYAAYTQVRYEFNPEWALTLGIRWAEDKKEADEQRFAYFEDNFTFTGYLRGIMPFIGGSAANTALANANIVWGAATLNPDPNVQINPVCGLKQLDCARPLRLGGIPFSNVTRTLDDDKWSEVTWRANVDWTPNDEVLVYASATTGYRAGGYSLGVASARDFARDANGNVISTAVLAKPFQYDKETVISFEVGYKDMFFDRRLQLFTSVYLYQYDDYQDQVNAFDPVRAIGVDVVQNAPEAENMGVEVELTWLPTDAVTVGLAYSWAATEYSEDYLVANFEDPSRPQSILGPIATNQAVYVENVQGNDLKRIPEHKATVWGSYEWETSFGNIIANATLAYTGSYYSSALNRSLDEVPDRTQVDVSLIWNDETEKFRVRAFCDNVFDEGYIRGVDVNGEAENWTQVGEYLYPRFYGVDVRYAFGD